MNVLNTATSLTGDWFRVQRDCDIAYATRNASVFGGATVAVQVGNELKVQLNQNADRNYTTGFDDVIRLKLGMHIRFVVTGDTTTTSIIADAFPADALEVVA